MQSNGSALINSSSNQNCMRLTHSQPYLVETETVGLVKDRLQHSSGTMYRPDILYQVIFFKEHNKSGI